MPIEDFVRQGDAPVSHPVLRFLAGKVKNGHHALFHLEIPARFVGFAKAKMSIRIFKGDEEISPVIEEWDADLNDGLIRLEIKAESIEMEKERFALALRASFRRPENRFGDGYFNSVLVDFVHERGLDALPVIAQILEHVPYIQPSKGQGYSDCKDMIDAALHMRGQELTGNLKYDEKDAVEILTGALAKYLDERYSVTNRRLLGLL